jgi:PIN domain nuclease of toxin-antitoxin system
VKLLLDTHAALWFLAGDPRLSSRARAVIEIAANERLFSIASAWEIAIKVSLGKLSLSAPFEDLVPGQLQSNGMTVLPIRPEHLSQLVGLPLHHRDPFDRLLVVQALVESAVLVSADPLLDPYGISRIW